MVVPACNLAASMQELGDFETAQAVLDETRALCETQEAADQLPIIDFQFALLRMDQGRNANAAALLRKAAALCMRELASGPRAEVRRWQGCEVAD